MAANLNPYVPPVPAANELAGLIAIIADPERARQQLERLVAVTAEATAALAEANEAMGRLAAADRASRESIAAERAKQEAELERRGTEFEARRLQLENAMAARERRVAGP